MIELLIVLPNILAQFMCSLNKAFYSNLFYSFGYLLFIWHNIKIGDTIQIGYFSFMEFMAVGGVIWYLWKTRKHAKKQSYYPPINGCYQPTGTLDVSNPPQSGSGLPSRPPNDRS